MAVQFADKALDEWLSHSIKTIKRFSDDEFEKGYVQALEETQKQLHAYWGSATKD